MIEKIDNVCSLKQVQLYRSTQVAFVSEDWPDGYFRQAASSSYGAGYTADG